MRYTLILFGLFIIVSSCNSGKIVELKYENEALRLELIEVKIKLKEAQIIAEEQTRISDMLYADMAARRARILEDSAQAIIDLLESRRKVR